MVRHRPERIPVLRVMGFLGAVAFAFAGCGGGSGGAAAGSGGNSGGDGSSTDIPSGAAGGGGHNADGGGQSADVPAGGDGAATGGAAGSGGKAGSGGDSGSGGAASGGSSGADASADVGPLICQAGEACTGAITCDGSRCVRGEKDVCHCINDTLFCGPVSCAVDAGTPDGANDDAAVPACPANTGSGDDCNPATDRACELGCINNRRHECFCSPRAGTWLCANTGRC